MFDIKINGHVHKITAKEIESNLSKETKEIIMNYNEEAKKRRTCPVYSSTYDNGGWSERDRLPEGDPIGDVDDSSYSKDQKSYDETMASRVLIPEDKYTYERKPLEVKKCDCGTEFVYGKVPLDAHRHYCKLRRES